MAATSARSSAYVQASTSTDREKQKAEDGARPDMWSSMLDGVASGKRLPEKNLLVLGGTSESQRELLEALSDSATRKAQERMGRKPPPIANSFALGYTYVDVLDADHDDILARLSVYFLSDPSTTFASLLRPLLTPHTIPNTVVVILLDWNNPWHWLRELREWIRLLRTLLVSLDEGCKKSMEDVMISWRDRGRGGTSLDGTGVSLGDKDVSLPLGPGEWDEAIGLPLCVVCQNADHMELLEKERAWKEEEFDFVLQFLRTVLLKHGASLIYTTPSMESQLQTLMHASLGIHSLLKRQPLKHNVIDRDKILVPPNWDSWGKIRVLREGFDVEGANNGWSIDIDENVAAQTEMQEQNGATEAIAEPRGAVTIFEDVIKDPVLGSFQGLSATANDHVFEDEHFDTQAFLATQLDTLEHLKLEMASTEEKRDNGRAAMVNSDGGKTIEDGSVSEHIGPVQFNMGGIQVDADDMLQRLKDRQRYQTPEPSTPTSTWTAEKDQNQAVASFFQNLMTRGGGSATNSPKPPA